MKGNSVTVIIVLLLLSTHAAFAHRIDEYLQATVVTLEPERAQVSMRLIPGVLVASAVIAGIDSNGDKVFSNEEQQAYARHVLAGLSITSDGRGVQPRLIAWSFPRPGQMKDGLGEIHIDYSVALSSDAGARNLVIASHPLSDHSVYLVNVLVPQSPYIQIVMQKRNREQSVYELDYQQTAVAEALSHPLWTKICMLLSNAQFTSLFHLGIRHIAEGTDHLLFLLTLLLPAPLLAVGARWGAPAGVRQSLLHILGIVTAFTIGHSITLTLAALGTIHIPGRPVEVLIAASIFVSAWHALRPVVPGKEALIAGFFGLIHGLAFAATLDRLGLGLWDKVAGILAFNLGIETMQMTVVGLLLPSLLLLSRTRAYPILRIGGAVFAGVASLGWMLERTFHVEMHVDKVVDLFAGHALSMAAALLLVALVCKFLLSFPAEQPSQHLPSTGSEAIQA